MNIAELSARAEYNEDPPYTRAQALADGALIDVSPVSKDAGFKVPVAVTAMVWTLLEPSERDERLGQTAEGRLRTVLAALRESATDDGVVVLFDVGLVDFGEPATWRFQAVISEGERGEPVVTIMLPHEA
ncbi:MAG: hypothetical protein IT377_07340 [Polyangiaceae bacterium]|nr:hypothetical protein [Polyangiaceae bacterium]